MSDQSDEGAQPSTMDVGGEPSLGGEVVRFAPFQPEAGREGTFVRETTARYLGLGMFWAFAIAVGCICAGHLYAFWILAQEPPPELKPEQVEIWFRWREQLGTSATSFGQLVGTLLAGPFGVVLGFYFRDRQA